jgi:hypothetical protein
MKENGFITYFSEGMMQRGRYKVSNYFIDSDKVKHLEFDYDFNIVK